MREAIDWPWTATPFPAVGRRPRRAVVLPDYTPWYQDAWHLAWRSDRGRGGAGRGRRTLDSSTGNARRTAKPHHPPRRRRSARTWGRCSRRSATLRQPWASRREIMTRDGATPTLVTTTTGPRSRTAAAGDWDLPVGPVAAGRRPRVVPPGVLPLGRGQQPRGPELRHRRRFARHVGGCRRTRGPRDGDGRRARGYSGGAGGFQPRDARMARVPQRLRGGLRALGFRLLRDPPRPLRPRGDAVHGRARSSDGAGATRAVLAGAAALLAAVFLSCLPRSSPHLQPSPESCAS